MESVGKTIHTARPDISMKKSLLNGDEIPSQDPTQSKKNSGKEFLFPLFKETTTVVSLKNGNRNSLPNLHSPLHSTTIYSSSLAVVCVNE